MLESCVVVQVPIPAGTSPICCHRSCLHLSANRDDASWLGEHMTEGNIDSIQCLWKTKADSAILELFWCPAELISTVNQWAFFDDLVSACLRREQRPKPQGSSAVSHAARLHPQLSAQSERCHPAFRCISTNMGRGQGPKVIPGLPWFQPLLLVAPQRGEATRGCCVLVVPFSKGQHHWEWWTSRPGCLTPPRHHMDRSSFHMKSHTRVSWGHPMPFRIGIRPLI